MDGSVLPGRDLLRFYCHWCIVELEFEDVQDDTCPYCGMGFIEEIENTEPLFRDFQESEYDDAEISHLDEAGGQDYSAQEHSLEIEISGNLMLGNDNMNHDMPLVNDLTFLTGRRARPRAMRAPRDTLMEQLVWILGAGRGAPGQGVVTTRAGAPFVIVGPLGDYVFGAEGLDTVVTQLLGQMENAGPPPLPTEHISKISSELITAAQVAANIACSICWDEFTLDESVSSLECAHIYHRACITHWLQLHATCPICRHSLLPPAPAMPMSPAPVMPLSPAPATPPLPSAPATPQTPDNPESQPADSSTSTASSSRTIRARADPATASGTSRHGPGFSRLWAQISSSISILSNFDASSSSNSGDTSGFIDIDFD